MQPFIIDPETYVKRDELERAVLYVEQFLDFNGIARVDEYLFEPDDTKKPPGRNPWHDRGWYWQGRLFVNLKKSRPPVKVPGFAWSYTGFKADLTAPGVLAHETGHHIHFQVDGTVDLNRQHDVLKRLKDLSQAEAPVSGYEPNPYEVMAEACRLFILNPILLKEGRPKRFEFLTSLGLKPLHETPWREVLVNAHPKIVSATENWISKREL